MIFNYILVSVVLHLSARLFDIFLLKLLKYKKNLMYLPRIEKHCSQAIPIGVGSKAVICDAQNLHITICWYCIAGYF